jgi:hypothetical protein
LAQEAACSLELVHPLVQERSADRQPGVASLC